MNFKKSKPMLIGFALSVLGIHNGYAQNAAQTQLIKDWVSDGTKIGVAYANPGLKAVSSGMATGWSNTARTLPAWKFEVRLGANLTWVPSSDHRFDVDALGLSSWMQYASNSQTSITPTVVGAENSYTVLQLYGLATPTAPIKNADGSFTVVDNGPSQLVTFRLLPGINRKTVPTPQLQFTLGLPLTAAISFRFVPNINIQDKGAVSSYGLALQKEIFHFKRPKTNKEFTLALLGGYSNLNYKGTMPEVNRIVQNPTEDKKATKYNQSMKGNLNVWNLDLMADYKIPFESASLVRCFTFSKKAYKPIEMYFAPFVTLGYQNAYNVINAYGTYNVKIGYNIDGSSNYVDLNGHDFINNSTSYQLNNIQGTAGFALNIGIFRLYSSYTMAKYNTLNAGMGFYFGLYKPKHNDITGF